VGSVAFDSVKTPFGEAKDVLGGSASYFSVAASYFTDVRLVAVIGKDFPEEEISVFRDRNIDIDGLVSAEGETFRWEGSYGYDLNEAHTIDTRLNVFADFKPDLPRNYRESEYVFLANIDPDLQREVLSQVKNPKFVACDTMNFWIENKRDSLKETIKLVDLLVINEGEARELGEDPNLVKAARKILLWGPKRIIIKRGEYGAIMFSGMHIFVAPAYPIESVFDPTGAGDSFAGGLMGYLARADSLSEADIRRGMVCGSTMASFNVEDFSLNRIKKLNRVDIMDRYTEFKNLTHFEDLSEEEFAEMGVLT
ncbi:MAG: PfkB family carbohydrate kinase, partial [Nitrospinota bacterium]